MAKTDQELAQEEMASRQYMYGGTGPFSQFLSGERREILRPESTQVAGFAAGPSGVEYITETIPGEYGPAEYDPSYSPVRRGLSALGDMLGEAPSFLGFRGPDEQAEAIQGVGSSLRDALFGTSEYMSEQARAAASGGEYFDPETGRIVAFDPTIVMGGGSSGGGPALASGFRRSGGRQLPKYEAMRNATVQRLKDKGIMSQSEFDRAERDSFEKTGNWDSMPEPKAVYTIEDSGSNSSYVTIKKPKNYAEEGMGDLDEYTIRFSDHSLPKQYSYDQNIYNVSEDYLDETINGKSLEDAIDYVDRLVPTDNYDTTDLYSGGGRQGTAIAAGSALRNELERISPGNFDYDLGFGVRAKERDQINQTEFRYSSNQMGEPKEISIFDLEGRPFVTTQSDRTDVGKSLTGIGDVDFDIPVDLLGGQGFMFRNPGELWASGNTVTPKIYEPAMLAKKNFALGGTLEDPLLLPYRMGAKGSDFSHMTTDTMLTYARNTMSPKTIKEANKQIKTFFPEFKGIENPESMRQLSRQPDPIRGKIRDIFDMKFRYDGALDLPSTRLAITDPKQYSALLGGLQNVGQFDLSRELFRGTHPSYPSTVPGQGLGQLKEKDISIFELMPDYVQYRGPVRTAQGKKGKEYQRGLDPTFTSTPVQTEMYGLQTGVRGAPGQQDPNKAQQFTGVITEDILRGIEARRAQ